LISAARRLDLNTMDKDSLTGEFLRTPTEASFLEHKQVQTWALLGFTLTFRTVFYLGFFATDVAAFGWGAASATLFCARAAVGLTAGTCAWLAYRRPLAVRATRLAATGIRA
jgi:hypothetical protein